MYIKRLELLNFKSFADRTRLDFTPGINVVVGPNGCGKSNILDSVRWVLGEQKTTVLRSKQMDEVIFAGTNKRKPAGMCLVAITLDNTDRMYPSDEDEVIITRKQFREGAGQYLFNNKVSRLRDIYEALADTGIGQGALFVLSAREVDQILSTNSEDRRVVVEETAGIKKYQLRKKETLMKLKSAKENIDRLNDILQEIDRQVKMSRRQLNTLNRYKKVKEQLSKLECVKTIKDMGTWKKKNDQIQAKIEEVEKKRRESEREIEKIEFEIHTARKERSRIASGLEKQQELYSNAGFEENEIRTEIDLGEERIRQAQDSQKEYRENLDQLTGRREKIALRMEKNQEDLEAARKIQEDLEAELERAEQERKTREDEFSRVSSEMESRKKSVEDIKTKLNTLELEKRLAENEIKSGEARQRENQSRALSLMEELETADGKISHWREKLDDLKSGRDGADQEFGRFREEYDKAALDITRNEKRLRGLKEQLITLRSGLSSLIREEENFRGFSEAFRAVMKNRDRLPQLIPVHTIINVEPEYETAADIILGQHFQSLITQSRRDADFCIDFLKRERAGRLTFFPLDMDRSGSSMPAFPMNTHGVVDWARNLIQCEPAYRDILDMICGKTLVVQDLQSAYRIYHERKKDHAFLPRIVTLEGDVLEFTGAVTGGKFRTDRTELLSRQRKRREMEEENSKLQKEAEECLARLNKYQESAVNLEAQRDGHVKKIQEMDKEITGISGQLEILQRMREAAREELKRIEDFQEKHRGTVILEQKKLDTMELDMSGLKENLEKKNTETLEMEISHRDSMAEMEKSRAALDGIKLRRDEARHRAGMLESKMEGDRHFLEQMEGDLGGVKERIEQKNTEISRLEKELQEARNRRSILKLKMKGLRINLDSAKGALAGADGKIEEAQTALGTESEQKRRWDEDFNDLRIRKVEVDSKLQYLDEKRREFTKDTRHSAANSKWKEEAIEKIQLEIERQRQKLHSFEAVNFSAEEEFNEHMERYNELKGQIDDLQASSDSLRKIIREMDSVSVKALEDTLSLLDERFQVLFKKVFGGGQSGVAFSDPENKLESGIDIMVQPPGKKASNINLLSSGERSLTAVTFLFALLSIKPGPFVILDELDAPLDRANVDKINNLVREFSNRSQFIVITHNRKTMEVGDTMFGVTMEEPGVSKMVSVKMN